MTSPFMWHVFWDVLRNLASQKILGHFHLKFGTPDDPPPPSIHPSIITSCALDVDFKCQISSVRYNKDKPNLISSSILQRVAPGRIQ